MISPKEIQTMSGNIIKLYTSIEDDLLRNVASRFSVLDEVTPDTVGAWQTEKLLQLGALKKENLKILSQYSGKTIKEITKILTDAGYQTLSFDEQIYEKAYSKGLLVDVPVPVRVSPTLRQVIKGAVSNTRKYFNLINTTALESAQTGFKSIINQTYLETSLGISDYSTAVKKAVINLADQGITGATYISKHGTKTQTHVDVAVRRCIVTSTAQTAGVMQEERAKEWGANLVEVTSHAGSRPEHAKWQGKIFQLDGSSAKYPNLRKATGYGTVTGLKGANCSHDFYPFFPGLSEQTYKPVPKEENDKVYEQSQGQRKLEREVRAQKRRVLTADAAGDAEGKTKAQLALKDKESQLKQFVKDTGRTQRTNRQQVNTFDHSQAMQAVWTKRKSD